MDHCDGGHGVTVGVVRLGGADHQGDGGEGGRGWEGGKCVGGRSRGKGRGWLRGKEVGGREDNGDC